MSKSVILSEKFVLDAYKLVDLEGKVWPFRTILTKKDEKVGIYQGTFDPFTITHRRLVQLGLQACDTILVYPTNRNSRKQPVALEHRIEMIRLSLTNLSQNSRLLIVQSWMQAPFPQFVRGCMRLLPCDPTILQGVDKLALPWYKDGEHVGRFIVDLPHVTFVHKEERKEYEALATLITGPRRAFVYTETIRSSHVRDRLHSEHFYKVVGLHSDVLGYIKERKLYEASSR